MEYKEKDFEDIVKDNNIFTNIRSLHINQLFRFIVR